MPPYTIRSFCAIFHISRPRLTRIVETALREHSGVFALVNYGYFKAERPGPKSPLEISVYYPTKGEKEAIQPLPVSGDAAPLQVTPAAPVPAAPAPAPAPQYDQPTEHEMKIKLLQARATALSQKNILEQAKLREETVSYCAQVIQLLLSGLRSGISDLHLDHAATSGLRNILEETLSDLTFVLPDIVAGIPVDRIELALGSRRAARLSAARQAQADQLQQKDSAE